MFQRVLAAMAVALLLVCAPTALTAQGREDRAVEQVSFIAWFAGVWNEVAALLTGQVTDGSCSLDPDGCPGGA